MALFFKGVDLQTPLKLKPGTSGKFRIERERISAGKDVTILSARNAIFMGEKPVSAKFNVDIFVHRLKMNGGLVTSDSPQEIYTQHIDFQNAWGTVLVGGLGIGMAAVMIANSPDVKRVIIVEIERDVIKLVKDQLPKTRAPVKIVHGDLFEILGKRRVKGFDFAYFDIWPGTGEGTWNDYVVPLRRLVCQKFDETIDIGCWAEKEMRGQMRLTLQNVIANMDNANAKPWINSFRPLWTFAQAWKIRGEFQEDWRRDSASMTRLYLEEIGSHRWESVFGIHWDSWKAPPLAGHGAPRHREALRRS